MDKGWIVGLLAGVMTLAACSSDDPSPTTVAFCNGFGNGATHSTSCGDCTFDSTAARDGSLQTAASIVPSPGVTSEEATLSATSVNDIPGGAIVGVWVTQPNTASITTNFETFLDGALQEELNLDPQTGNGVILGADQGTPAQGFIGMQTTLEFDQVRFTTTNTWAAGASPVYFVYEICSDGGAS